MKLREEITKVLNKASAENASDTPDFILAEYLMDSLKAFDVATSRRDRWYGITERGGDRLVGKVREDK